MKYFFFGDDLFFYLLKESFPFPIERITSFGERDLTGTFLVTDKNVFSIDNLPLYEINQLYVFSDIIDTSFYKQNKEYLNKISFNKREEYIHLEKLIDIPFEKTSLSNNSKIILSDTSVDLITTLDEIEYFAYNRAIKKSSATVAGKTYFLRKSLTHIENYITKCNFIRVERGTILNLKKIKEVNYKNEYILTNSGEKIYLGRSTLKKIIENNFKNFHKL